MVESGRLLVVTGEKDSGSVRWYHEAFAFTQDTPHTFPTAAELNCKPNRDYDDSHLFIINRWITRALSGAGDIASSAAVLEDRLAQCREERGLVPNTLAVDFYVQGDFLSVVAELNGVPRKRSPG